MFLWGNELLITSKSGVTTHWRLLGGIIELGGWLNSITFKFLLRLSLYSKKEGEIKEKTWTYHLSLSPTPESISLIFSIVYNKVHLQVPPVYGGSAELTTSDPGLQKKRRIASNPIVQRVG